MPVPRSRPARLSIAAVTLGVLGALLAPAVAVPVHAVEVSPTAPATTTDDGAQPEPETGDPLLEGMTAPPQENAPVAADARLAFGGAPVLTDAVTSAFIDPDSNRAYSATRSASPAELYTSSRTTGTTAVAPKRLIDGTGSWDMAKSGSTLAVGTNGATGQNASLLGFDITSSTFFTSVPLPGSSMVLSVIEDTLLAAPGNGRYFWVGTYAASGAKLFRVDLVSGTAVDRSPQGGAWKSFRYLRSLVSDPSGLTIGLGSPAAVWRLDAGGAQPTPWTGMNSAVAGRSLAYASASASPPGAANPTVLVGTEATAALAVSTEPAAAPRVLPLDGNTVDRIATNPNGSTAWFTVRPSATLYSLDLADPSATPVAHGAPVPDSETRAISVIDGVVWGVTGTSQSWSYDPATGTSSPPIDLLRPEQELRDTVPQGVVPFGDRVLVGGHWRYQVHGDPSTNRVRMPGEPKAQTVLGDKLYSAVYPSASVYELDSNLEVRKVASIGHGQMRPAAVSYSDALHKLVVATGPAYGKYGGGLSLMDAAPDSAPQVYTSPVGKHQVVAIEPVESDLLLGTAAMGEAMPALPGERAKVVRWRAEGDTASGTPVWSLTLPVAARRINGMHLVSDESGRQLVVAADPASGASGWLLGIDPETGAVLWQQLLSGPARSLHASNGYLVLQVSSVLRQVGVSRTGATLTRIRDMGESVAPSFVAMPDAPRTAQRVAYVSGGIGGVVGIAEQGTPRVPARVSGDDRYATAVAVSRQSYARANTVLLARGDDFADALAAGPLAAALNAPILLVQPGGRLSPTTVAEIRRLGAVTALPIGGTGAIPNSVAAQLPSGVSLSRARLQGENRYETSVAVAERLEAELGGAKRPVFVATGTTFADAIAAVPAAVSEQRTIVLYDNVAAARKAKRFLVGRSIDALGGPASSAVRAAGLDPDRTVIGSDRFDTAKRIATSYFGTTPRAYLAPGLNFPDGLAAGALAGRSGAPLLLAVPSALTAPTEQALRDRRGSEQVTLVGGTGVLSAGLQQSIASLP